MITDYDLYKFLGKVAENSRPRAASDTDMAVKETEISSIFVDLQSNCFHPHHLYANDQVGIVLMGIDKGNNNIGERYEGIRW